MYVTQWLSGRHGLYDAPTKALFCLPSNFNVYTFFPSITLFADSFSRSPRFLLSYRPLYQPCPCLPRITSFLRRLIQCPGDPDLFVLFCSKFSHSVSPVPPSQLTPPPQPLKNANEQSSASIYPLQYLLSSLPISAASTPDATHHYRIFTLDKKVAAAARRPAVR